MSPADRTCISSGLFDKVSCLLLIITQQTCHYSGLHHCITITQLWYTTVEYDHFSRHEPSPRHPATSPDKRPSTGDAPCRAGPNQIYPHAIIILYRGGRADRRRPGFGCIGGQRWTVGDMGWWMWHSGIRRSAFPGRIR